MSNSLSIPRGLKLTHYPGWRNVSLVTIDKFARALGVDSALLVSDLPFLAEPDDSRDS